MKPNSSVVTHEGTMTGENKVKMTFDEEAHQFLMGALTDMYTDRELATIREPASNANDTHRRVGNDAPIEVTLPSSLNPTYIVKDYGTGLSVDDIYRLFAKYGASTKRGDDLETGMYGIGCKAPLTYTSQFSVVTTRDGIQTTVSITRAEGAGGGDVEVVDTCSTDEPNGTEVIIPVRHVRSFIEKAMNFFRFWEPGSVLVDGVEPESIFSREDNILLDPDVVLTRHVPCDYVIQGNVPYPIPAHGRKQLTRSHRYRVVARVPLGTVAVTPPREGLDYTPPTEEALRTIRHFVSDISARVAADRVDACATPREAMIEVNRLRRDLMWVKKWYYRGKEVPLDLRYGRRHHVWWSRDIEEPARKIGALDVEHLGTDTLHVVGYKGASLRKDAKEKIQKYADARGISYKRVIVYATDEGARPWVDGVTRVEWEDVKKIRLTSAPRKKKSDYLLLRSGGDTMGVADLPASTKHIYYFSPTQVTDARWHVVRAFSGPDVAIVIVTKNRWAKFKREHPTAEHIYEAIRGITVDFLAALTAEQRYAITDSQYVHEHAFAKLDPDRIDDPALSSMLATVRSVPIGLVKRWTSITFMCRHASVAVPKLPEGILMARYREMEEKYKVALLGMDQYRWGDVKVDDFHEAINALYAARNPWCVVED